MLTSSRSAARLSRLFHNVDLRFFPNLSAAPKELTRGEDKETRRQGDKEKKTGKGSSLIPGVHPQGRTHPSSLAVVDDLEPGGNWDALDTFVAGGGSLLILGGAQLLGAGLPDTTASTDIVYEDFEAKTYDTAKWTVEGNAFGTGPARGTLGGQQNVSGFGGQGLVNTYLNGDAATGKLTSKTFTIERRYIHFLIGGGNHAGQTCINLRVGGKIVRTEVGHNEEHLRPEKWEVGEFHGQQAQIEIVDTSTDAWGHINIDDIVFSDSIIARSGVTPEQKAKIRAFLPFTYTNVARPGGQTHTFNAADAPLEFFGLPTAGQAAGQSITVADNAILIDFHAKPDAVVHRLKYEGQPFAIEWTHGKGRAILLLAGFGTVVYFRSGNGSESAFRTRVYFGWGGVSKSARVFGQFNGEGARFARTYLPIRANGRGGIGEQSSAVGQHGAWRFGKRRCHPARTVGYAGRFLAGF